MPKLGTFYPRDAFPQDVRFAWQQNLGIKTKLGLEKTQMHVLKNIEMFYGRWIRTFMKIVYKEFLMVVSLHWMKSKSS